MRTTFVVLGGTGDLTGRLLLPGLAELYAAGAADGDVDLLAVSSQDWTDEDYRDWARARLAEHATHVPEDVRDRVVGRLGHQRGDVTDAEDLRVALDRAQGRLVVYLALPNVVFLPTLQALGEVGLPDGTTIAVEKPFGRDRSDARELNAVLHRLVPEERVFRIDHFLAMPTVLAVIGLRFGNRLFEPVWNAEHIAAVEIIADETLGLEGRAGYYDTAGALRDMLQNHLLQQLALVAMERPQALDRAGLGAAKAAALQAVRPPTDMARDTVRGRYTAGTVAGRQLPDYVAEDGVDPARETETYAEYTVTIDSERWAGVPFRLRTGKALGRTRQEIVVRFHPAPDMGLSTSPPEPDVLRLRAADPDHVTLEVNLTGGDDPFGLARRELDVALPPTRLWAYGLLLQQLLTGEATLSVSDVEAEEQWRIVEPILAAWAAGEVPLREYPAGSAGPV